MLHTRGFSVIHMSSFWFYIVFLYICKCCSHGLVNFEVFLMHSSLNSTSLTKLMQHTRVCSRSLRNLTLNHQLLRCEHKPRDQRILLSLVFILCCPTYDFKVHVESLNRSINWRFSHYKSEFTTLGIVTQDLIYFGSPL